MRKNLLIALLLLAPAAGLAQVKKVLTRAVDAVEDARERARRSNNYQCRDNVATPLDDVSDAIEALRRRARPREVAEVRAQVVSYAAAASASRCPYEVVQNLQRAAELLEEAREAVRRSHRHDDDDDDGDEDRPGHPSTGWVRLGDLKVTVGSVYEGEPAVRLSVPELQMRGLRGQTFFLATKFRSAEGVWSGWVSTQLWTVPSDPFVWRNALTHFLRYSTLAEDDFADGRYVVHVGVFDGAGRELGFREAPFKVRVPQLPPPPPPLPPGGPPPPTLPGPPVTRDCGTGDDPGCLMVRDGTYPMDAMNYGGFMHTLRSKPVEPHRRELALTVLANSCVTALQLFAILDLFTIESFRFEVAKAALPRLVNPQHAMGLPSKFKIFSYARELNELLAQQNRGRGGLSGQPAMQPPGLQPQGPPAPPNIKLTTLPPPPGGPAGPPPPPPPAPAMTVPSRDCGTGQDPGCSLARGGQYPMDGTTFQGVLTALRSDPNEINRRSVAFGFFDTHCITALQLAQFLDLFGNELLRLEVAKKAAPRVVNPTHAIGYASKFHNNLLGNEYTLVMAAQRP